MNPKRRPPLFVSLCALLLSAPAAVLLCFCFAAFFMAVRDPNQAGAMSGPGGLGLVIFPVPLALLLLLEHRAIFRRDPKAAGWIAGLCLYLPVCGSIGWLVGLLTLLKVLPQDHQWRSWAELGIYTAVLVVFGIIGLAHLRWHNTLAAEKPAEALEPEL